MATRRRSLSDPIQKTPRLLPVRRAESMPTGFQRPSSILKVKTLRESLSMPYEPSSPKGLVWKEIHIREYERTVGDNPSCSSGPPISIGWCYSAPMVLSVNDYEAKRPPRRSNAQMVVPRDERTRMLVKEWNVPQLQVAAAVRRNIKVKSNRRQTVNNLGKVTKMEEAMESARRKITRTLTFQKSTSAQVETMTRKHLEAEAMRAKLSGDSEPLKNGKSTGGKVSPAPTVSFHITAEEKAPGSDEKQEDEDLAC